MDRTRVLTVIAGVAAVVLVVLAATADPVPIADRAPQLPFELPDLRDVDRPQEATITSTVPSEEREAGSETAEWVTLIFELTVMFLMLGALAFVVKRLWGDRPATVVAEASPDEPLEVLAEVRDAIVEDADEQLRVLRTGEPRNAIVECWLRVETLVADRGLDHDPADTSTELTAKVLAGFEVDGDAVDRLAALYREARFSTHAVGEQRRTEAIGALQSIHTSLRTRPTVSS